MADLLCSFCCFRSLTTKKFLFLPPRQYYSSALNSHNSRIARIKTSSPHLLPLFKPSPFAAPASDIDVISTHEHSDGSLIFRFGDPSEIQEIVEIEEPKNQEEEIEGEDENESTVVKVVEVDDETESVASGLTEASDLADSTVSSSKIATSLEGDNEFSDKLFEVLDDAVELKDLIIEPSENVEDINEEHKDLSPLGASIPDESLNIEDSITTSEISYEESLEEASNVTSTSKEAEITSTPDVEVGELTLNVVESLNQEDSPADVHILDQNSEAVDNVTSTSKETEITSTPGVEVGQLTVIVEECVNQEDPIVEECLKQEDSIAEECLNQEDSIVEECLNQEDSPADASILDQSSEVVDNVTTVAFSEKESDDISSADIGIDQSGKVDEVLNGLDRSFRMVDGDSTVALLEKEFDGITSLDIEIEPTGDVKEFTDEEYEDSLVESTLDKRSEVFSADITSTPDIDIEHTSNVEEGIDEVVEEPSLVDASLPNEGSEVEKEAADAITLVDFRTEPVDDALDTETYGSLQTADTTSMFPNSEHQNVETVIQDETISDGRESSDNNLVSPSPELESAMSLYEETEEPNLEAELQTLATEEISETDNMEEIGMPNVLRNGNESDVYGVEAESPTTGSMGSEEQVIPSESVGYVSEKDMIQLVTVPPQLEAESILEEETGSEIVEEPREDDALEDQIVIEDSVHEVMASEYTESSITSPEILVTDFILSSGAALLPHPSKVSTGAEDAYFITGQTWFGVADGVSQWSLEGTTPGVYGHELIKSCERIVFDCNGSSVNNPIELLNLGVAQTQFPGSSTILIAQFDGQSLHVTNIGNSGFIVLRHGAVYKRSSPMLHAFSLPVQIERGDDPPSLAELYRVDLEEGDIVIAATDGLFDNLYDQEILLITIKSLADNRNLEEIAELLGKRAQEVGRSAYGRSPFADEAQAAGFPGYSGGKLDDVAVIVSVVKRR